MSPRAGKEKTPPKPKEVAALDHLHFYFDAVERDRLDTSGVSRKTGEVLALRDKLLTLPEGEFAAAMKTLKRMVADVKKAGDSTKDKAKEETRKRKQAAKLFEQVAESTKGSGTTAQAQKVSVV